MSTESMTGADIPTTLVLASRSPRRTELLNQVGLGHTIDPAEVAEVIPRGFGPAEAARHLATLKAGVVAERYTGTNSLVMGADTIVSVDGHALGKPVDSDDAVRMLKRLSGTTHEVHTGICIVATLTGDTVDDCATTRVTMRTLTDAEIVAYTATGEAADAAGSYAIQGRAAVFVSRIDGDYTNVVGLPLHLAASLLGTLGLDVASTWSST